VPGQLLGNPNCGWIRGVWREDGRVRKVLVPARPDAPAHWAASNDPRAWSYWRREELVYMTGLPARLGIDAPALLGVERHGEEVHLLLEDVAGRTGAELRFEELVEAARIVGRSQGAAAANMARWPDGQLEAWLSKGFLRAYPASKPANWPLLADEAAWQHPLVREHLAPAVRAEALRQRREYESLHALHQRLPRTTCHLDVWPHNLIARPNGHIAFVDWSFCGEGAIGEDVGNLVPDSVFDRLLPDERLDELDAAATAAYLDGLRDAGFEGDARLARLGICLGGVLKYDWLVPLTLQDATSGAFRDYGSGSGVEAHAFMGARGAGLDLVARWAAEARALAAALGL
jgi:hypothetical protein